MRLIDADVLPKYTGYALSADEVAKAVENAPTIEAEPVRRGRWEAMDWANEYYKCSECGRVERWSPNYCASCGTKMATRTRYVRGTPNIIEEPNGRAKMEEQE